LASLGFIWRFFFACNGLVLLNKTCNHSFNTHMLGFPTNSWNLAKGNDIIHVYPPLYMESMRYKVVTSPSCPAPDQWPFPAKSVTGWTISCQWQGYARVPLNIWWVKYQEEQAVQ
jgi:hypothetical protein